MPSWRTGDLTINSVRLHYERSGSGEPALLFVHEHAEANAHKTNNLAVIAAGSVHSEFAPWVAQQGRERGECTALGLAQVIP